MYTGFPHLEKFGEAYRYYCVPAVEQYRAANLCYNGDIWDTDCYKQLIERFPAIQTVMIGRGLLGRPDLACCIKGIEPTDTRQRIKDFCHEIYDGYLTIFSGEKDVCMHMKEIWANLGRSFEGSDGLLKKLMKAQTPSEFRFIQEQILDTLELSRR